MSYKRTKNDIAWEQLFHKFDILSCINIDGYFRISAPQINQFREARLMTKFDHKSNLPLLFRENHLSILPVTRGDYIIAPMEVYNELEELEDVPIQYFELPDHLNSLNQDEITSEAAAISCAYASGMLEDFLGEELIPTVNGRMSSESFSFKVDSSLDDSNITLEISNSQIEIDGGYEGIESLCLIEAKNSISTDFLIRQLYFPFRLWGMKIDKPVRLIFMVYTNGIFNLYEYKFKNICELNSIVLIKSGRYSLEQREISIDELQKSLNSVTRISEPEVPFPQADSFDRLINLCELLFETELTKDEITTTYDFDSRQTDYYSNAGRYLGLIEESVLVDVGCKLSDKGRSLFCLNFKERQLKLAELILEHSVFADVLGLYFEKAAEPSRDDVIEIMRNAGLYHVGSESTYRRRASTVLSWVNWILGLTLS